MFSLFACIRRAYSAKLTLHAGFLAVNALFNLLNYKAESLCFMLIQPSFRGLMFVAVSYFSLSSLLANYSFISIFKDFQK